MTKTIDLTIEQQQLVESSLYIVKRVLRDNIIVNECIFGFSYDDLFQEGSLWLCKAVATFDESRNVKFETYAYTVVSNGLRTYCRLMCNREKRIISIPLHDDGDNVFAMEHIADEDGFETYCSDYATYELLNRMKQQYKGTVKLGIEALEWKVRGFSGREIANMYGVQPNLVGAWISRAIFKLKQNDEFMRFCGKLVESRAD